MHLKIGKRNKYKTSSKNKELGKIGNWIQRIELKLDSLEKRLDAVERRLSDEPFEGLRFGEERMIDHESFGEKFTEVKKEIALIKEEMNKLKNYKEKIPVISLKKRRNTEQSNEYMRKIEKIEEKLGEIKNKTIVKIGRVEFPMEITGIVGGIIAFIMGILLFLGYRETVVSPSFAILIGIILLFSTGIKIYLVNRNVR
ncbi:MAG TPA: hypothetical protein ENI33_07280 [Thermoplasmatales archaeon]|nr:hypothetical protein [Thermoplasmatales archaeon]